MLPWTPKLKVYRAVVLSSLLYGCETWTVYRRHSRQLERFHQRALLSILEIRWQDMVTNTEVFERTNCISIEAMLLKSCLRWKGHVIRMEDHRIPKRILFGELEKGHRKQDRPRKCFKDTVKAGLKWCGISSTELVATALDRQRWRTQSASSALEEERRQQAQSARERRHLAYISATTANFQCPVCAVPSLRTADRLVGLVVKVSASRAEGPRFESRLRRDFFGVESYQ